MQACNTDPSTGSDDPENRLRGDAFSAWVFTGANSYKANFRERMLYDVGCIEGKRGGG
jgi:hypothetical protein